MRRYASNFAQHNLPVGDPTLFEGKHMYVVDSYMYFASWIYHFRSTAKGDCSTLAPYDIRACLASPALCRSSSCSMSYLAQLPESQI